MHCILCLLKHVSRNSEGEEGRKSGPRPRQTRRDHPLEGELEGGGGGGVVGHQTGVRFRGSQTVFWVLEGGVRAEVSLSLLLDPHLHREKSYCVMCQRGFLAGEKKKCRAAV